MVIVVDGTPVATAHPDKARNDVVAATGQAGLAQAGFEAAFRTTAGHRLEVYGECGDGTFFKLVGRNGRMMHSAFSCAMAVSDAITLRCPVRQQLFVESQSPIHVPVEGQLALIEHADAPADGTDGRQAHGTRK